MPRPPDRPSSAAPVLAPSDLEGATARTAMRVGGRVARVEGPELELRDAFATVRAVAAEPWPVVSGDLVIVEGRLGAEGLTGARLCEHHQPLRPPLGAEGREGETHRLATRGHGSHLRQRAAVIAQVRRFFTERRFLEVDTPVAVRCPGLDLHLEAFALTEPLAAAPAFLGTSPEYHMKRLLAGGLPRIFQLARCFRRDEQGPLHNPEFLMLEWYRAFATMAELMDETEQLVREVLLEQVAGELQVGSTGISVGTPFERWSVREAFARMVPGAPADPIALAHDDEEQFFRLWVEQLEPALARFARPVFIMDFPACHASLARRKPGHPELCERFELVLGGIELCNGFGELTDPAEQRQRFVADQQARTARGQPVYPLDERFLGALEEGLPPAAGNALGLDRLVAIAAGVETIADALPFPAQWL